MLCNVLMGNWPDDDVADVDSTVRTRRNEQVLGQLLTAMTELQTSISQLQTDVAELKASNQRTGLYKLNSTQKNTYNTGG